MASGFSGGGDFYSSVAGINGGGGGGGSTMNLINSGVHGGNIQVHGYRPQLGGGGVFLDSSASSPAILPQRRSDLLAKRSLAELQLQHQQQQQQQQAFLLRSVKQRTAYQNRSSPISPLDLDVSGSGSGSATAVVSSSRYGNGNGFGNGYGYGNGGLGIPLLRSQSQKSMITQNSYFSSTSTTSEQPCLSNLSFSNGGVRQESTSENDSEKKMRNQLQELEKQLLLDDLDEGDDVDGGDAASVITGSEWSETMQILLSPTSQDHQDHQSTKQTQNPTQTQTQNQKPLSPSPTTSSTSSTSSSSSSASIKVCSSKQTLIDAATAISEGEIAVALTSLDRLKPISNTKGDPEQRLTSYMASALRSRINPVENPPPVAELSNSEEIMATQMLYEASPCFKLGFMAANLAILDGTRDRPNNVHVLDFDIGQGIHYLTLIHALAERASGKPATIKITAVSDPSTINEDGLRIVGERLHKMAERVRIGFKFNVIRRKVADLNLEALCLDPDEAVAVNFAFRLHKLPDESVSTENPRDELLRFVKSLSPMVVTLVEQEMNCNTAPFVARVTESCSYYKALFDSLDSTMARDLAERVRIEECLAKKAANTVACEGRERVERCEVFGKWRARMGMAGFEPKPLSQSVGESLRSRLSSAYRNNNGFMIKEENGGICFGWMGRVLTVASAWR